MLEWLRDNPLGFLQYMLYRAPAVLLALTLHEYAHGYVAYLCGDTTAKDLGRLSLNPLKHLDLVGTLGMFLMGIGWAKPVPVNPANFRNGRVDDLKVSLAGVTTNFLLFLLATLLTLLLAGFLYIPEVGTASGQNFVAYFRLQGLDISSGKAFPGVSFLLNFQSSGFHLQTNPEYTQYLAGLLKTPWLLHIQRFLLQLALVNLGMCLFNLLPIPPLDGFHVVNDIFLKGRIQLGGQVFRFLQVGLVVLLLTTDFVGNFVTQGIYAVQGALLTLLFRVFGVA